MKLKTFSQCLLITLSILLIERTDSAPSSNACMRSMPAVSKVVNALGSRLETFINKYENYFISPVSITLALAMVFIGARGTTREQMSTGMGLNSVAQNCLPNKVSENFRELIRSLVNEDETNSLLIANGAFVQVRRDISQFYASNLAKYFNTNVQYLNFEKEEKEAMDAINRWVANYTRNKIPQLIQEPLNPLTVMVLVNAVYFKGLWDLPFDENATRNSQFYNINGTNKVVPFMEMQDKVNYYLDEQTQYSFIELDYSEGTTSMIFVLPQNQQEIPENVLTSDMLCELRDRFELRSVNILIPKFKLEFSRELSKDMIALGMDELFSERADLTGIREQGDLHVSLMLHKAVIEVNEKGSEAAAVSGIGIDGRLKLPQKETFWANHPFLFYIIHRDTDTILFSGRLNEL